MFESFIIMLREGIEAALVVAIALVVIERAGRKDLRRAVFLGLWVAVAASVVVAFALHSFLTSSDAYEGVFYWVAAGFVISMLIWMRRKARTLKGDIEQRVTQAASVDDERSRRKEAAGLGVFVFFMVFREGIEAVLFMSAVTLTTTALLSFTGSALGLIVAIVFAVLFTKGSVKVDLKRFFAVTEWVLGIFVIQLLINGYHELAESGLMPATQKTMALVGPIVKNEDLFLIAILAIPLLIWLTRKTEAKVSGEAISAAQDRLSQARARTQSLYQIAAALYTLPVVGMVGIAYAKSTQPKTVPIPNPVVQQADAVLIPVNELADGKLHHYSCVLNGRSVVFVAMKLPGGVIKTALNACQICGPAGYIQDGPNLQCLNCEAAIEPLTLGSSGGCNPIPIPSRRDGENIRIRVSSLAASTPIFAKETGTVEIDAVCGMRLQPSQIGFTTSYKGKDYHFCKMPECRAVFAKNPEKFVGKDAR